MPRFLILASLAMQLSYVQVALSQDELPQGNKAGARAPGARSAIGQPAGPAAGNEFKQQVSYAIGRDFMQKLRESEVEVDMEALTLGISDALSGAKPKWTDEQLEATMTQFMQQMQQKAMSRMNQVAAQNKKESDAFFAQNGKREGVQTTPSGLQYIVLKEADGPSPTMNDTVRCNYRGTLLNGTEFDNSARRGGPAEFTIAPGLIAGWIEALQKMHVGEKWQIFVPPNLAYDTEPPQGTPIEPNSALVFEIELVEIAPK